MAIPGGGGGGGGIGLSVMSLFLGKLVAGTSTNGRVLDASSGSHPVGRNSAADRGTGSGLSTLRGWLP